MDPAGKEKRDEKQETRTTEIEDQDGESTGEKEHTNGNQKLPKRPVGFSHADGNKETSLDDRVPLATNGKTSPPLSVSPPPPLTTRKETANAPTDPNVAATPFAPSPREAASSSPSSPRTASTKVPAPLERAPLGGLVVVLPGAFRYSLRNDGRRQGQRRPPLHRSYWAQEEREEGATRKLALSNLHHDEASIGSIEDDEVATGDRDTRVQAVPQHDDDMEASYLVSATLVDDTHNTTTATARDNNSDMEQALVDDWHSLPLVDARTLPTTQDSRLETRGGTTHEASASARQDSFSLTRRSVVDGGLEVSEQVPQQSPSARKHCFRKRGGETSLVDRIPASCHDSGGCRGRWFDDQWLGEQRRQWYK